MLKKTSSLLGVIFLVISVFLTACAGDKGSPTPQSVTMTDGLGRTIELSGPALRIVSMAPSNTELLYAVGAGSQVVGRDDFSDFPEEAKDVASIGGSMGNYNNESIVSLTPDLVLASELNTPEQVAALEKLGLKVYLLPNPTDLEGVFTNLRTVASLTGKTAVAEKLIQELQARVAIVEEKMAGVESKPLVFYELDATDQNAPYTSGPGTFIDVLLAKAGAKNLGSTLGAAWAQISLEELLVQNPEVILLGDAVWGGITPEIVAQRAGWEGLAAVQNGMVYPFDDNLVSRPGPRLVDGLEQLAKLLHPEQFK